MWRRAVQAALGIVLTATAVASAAAELRVAVATNFLAPLQVIAEAFEAEHGVPVRISAGATGQHYAQIINGAPFDVFLAADQDRPRRLEADGLAVIGSRMTYAEGRLVLWARPGQSLPEAGLAGLASHLSGRLAMANPRLAPYGLAARQALEATGQWGAMEPSIIQGQNVGQALQYLATGNASHALVAASYAHRDGRPDGEWVLLPEDLHAPIRQDAVMLENAPNPDAARRFLAFLDSDPTHEIMVRFGYRPPEAAP